MCHSLAVAELGWQCFFFMTTLEEAVVDIHTDQTSNVKPQGATVMDFIAYSRILDVLENPTSPWLSYRYRYIYDAQG